ncbi:MAG: glycine cleavage system H protein [Planctomycetota bacterium]|nr:MAG: glycine cleavage system H protein [Planctomycetota bacterium]
MSEVPAGLHYTASHEWARPEGEQVVVGITAFAVESLQDLVFIELPKLGDEVRRGERFGEIESVKAVSDLYSPVDGSVVAVNEALANDLDRLSRDPYGEGWLIRIAPRTSLPEALAGLLDAAAYRRLIEQEEHGGG